VNPVMAIWSLGQSGINANFTFTPSEPFTIESGGPSAEYAAAPSSCARGIRLPFVERRAMEPFSSAVPSLQSLGRIPSSRIITDLR
jgi:hypothetical protein